MSDPVVIGPKIITEHDANDLEIFLAGCPVAGPEIEQRVSVTITKVVIPIEGNG